MCEIAIAVINFSHSLIRSIPNKYQVFSLARNVHIFYFGYNSRLSQSSLTSDSFLKRSHYCVFSTLICQSNSLPVFSSGFVICVTPGQEFVACSSYSSVNPEVIRNDLQASVYMICFQQTTITILTLQNSSQKDPVRVKPPGS